MKITSNINSKKNIRTHTVKGIINISDLIGYLKNLYDTEHKSTDMHVFWDLRIADFSKVKTTDVHNFMEFVSKNWGTSGNNKAALIVSKDFDYGLSRMYQILMDNTSQSKISIFKDLDEAEKWIDSQDE